MTGMGKALIIAEKPSVAADIARALGGFKKSGEFYESDHYVLSSAVGHLLELAAPAEFEAKKGKWTFAHLPVLPPRFDLIPIERNENRLKLLTKLIKRKDVATLINACDAGREGELIFRLIAEHAQAPQPVQRLWLQSMTPAAIRDGFARLRSDDEMRPLAHAARSRAEADWLIGINGTRAMTAFNSKAGGFFLTTVGRVQTPTLAILVEREARIKRFQSRDYWEVHGHFLASGGEYTGRWFDEQFARKEGEAELRAERLWDAARAEAIRAKCLGRPGVVTEESKPSTQLSPLLFDLTSLQREANSRFGFSAKTTLSVAQSLYEKHKVLTYPRTDARALPEDYVATVQKTMTMLEGTRYAPFAQQVLTSGWVRPNKRIFNNAKISDHFAIIPTTQAPASLSEIEAKLYDLVAKRFLAVFYPAAEFLLTSRITRVEGEPFKSEGKVLTSPGWLTVYGKEVQDDDAAPSLAPVQPNEQVNTTDVQVVAARTKPPARFTEATLLGAMESAGKTMDDDEMREAMRDKGLGTPATRAQIIEGLIYEEYVHRLGRDLQPTAKAFLLIELLHGLGVAVLTSPELTGDWELKLRNMQRGQLPREEFMRGISALTQEMVAKAKSFEHDTVPGDFGALTTPCPKCGGEVHEQYNQFACQKPGCGFSLRRILGSRLLELEEVEQLIRQRQIGPLQGFRSRKGKPFNAALKLSPEFKVEFDFGNGNSQEGGEGKPESPQFDFTGQEPVGTCPKCGARVFEAPNRYLCEKGAVKPRQCDFSSGKIILQQPLERAQMAKLIQTGKSDLLDKFVSRFGKPFKAFLALKEGKVTFEFEKRDPNKARAARANKPKEPAVKLDFAGQEPLGKCPRCGGRIFEGPEHYLCEKTQADKKPCKFKTGKLICQQPVDHEQLQKLLSQGRTDVLEKFISRFGKPFKAALTLDENNKVVFDFPPR